MTCHQFLHWIANADGHGTAAERSAVQRHVGACRSCEAEVGRQLAEEIRKCGVREIAETYADVVIQRYEDSFDPEAR